MSFKIKSHAYPFISAVTVGGGGIGGIIASVAFRSKDARSGYRPGLWTTGECDVCRQSTTLTHPYIKSLLKLSFSSSPARSCSTSLARTGRSATRARFCSTLPDSSTHFRRARAVSRIVEVVCQQDRLAFFHSDIWTDSVKWVEQTGQSQALLHYCMSSARISLALQRRAQVRIARPKCAA